MEMIGVVGDVNVLNCSVINRAILIGRAVDIADLERHVKCVERGCT